jgi:hypothetical protein
MRKTTPHTTSRIYRAKLSRTPAGSPVINIVPLHPTWPSGGHRQVAAFLYDLASEIEKRSDQLTTRPQWVTSVETWNARVILELGNEHEAEIAKLFLAKLLLDRNLD